MSGIYHLSWLYYYCENQIILNIKQDTPKLLCQFQYSSINIVSFSWDITILIMTITEIVANRVRQPGHNIK